MIDLLTTKVNLDLSKLRNKRILITGASGLLGINLLSSIKSIQKEYNIDIWVWTKNYSTSYLFNDCKKISYNDNNNDEIWNFLSPFDYIIHSAGYAQPTKFLEDKLSTIKINTHTTQKLLNLLKPNGSFLFISSSEVYNGLFHLNIKEDEMGITNTDHPRASYIEGKKCGETICNVFREKGIDAKVARLSIIYGPGTKEGDTRVINTLINQGINNPTIQLLDSGKAIRTLCYIDNAVEMMWNILLNGRQFIYNVGGIDTVTILDLARVIGALLGKEIILPEIENKLVGNPKVVKLSIQRYIDEFGDIEFTGLNTGLIKTINWQKSFHEKY